MLARLGRHDPDVDAAGDWTAVDQPLAGGGIGRRAVVLGDGTPQSGAGRRRRTDGRPAGSGCSRSAADAEPRPAATRGWCCGSHRAREAGRRDDRSAASRRGSDVSVSVRPTARPFHERPRSFENCSENSSVPSPPGLPRRPSLAAVDGHREAPDDGRPFRSIARPDGLAASAFLGALDDAEPAPGATSGTIASKTNGPAAGSLGAAPAPAAERGQAHHRRGGEHLALGAEQLRDVRRRPRAPRVVASAWIRVTLFTSSGARVVDRPEDGDDRLGLHPQISRAAIPAGRIGDVLPWPQVRIDEVRRLASAARRRAVD